MDISIKSFKRLVVIIAGFIVLFVGIAMLVLPGPGIVFIILGLTLLAAEFVWARYMLNNMKRMGTRIKDEAILFKDKVKRRI